MLSAAKKLTQQRQSILWKRDDLKLLSTEMRYYQSVPFGEFNTGIPLILNKNENISYCDVPTTDESRAAGECLDRRHNAREELNGGDEATECLQKPKSKLVCILIFRFTKSSIIFGSFFLHLRFKRSVL